MAKPANKQTRTEPPTFDKYLNLLVQFRELTGAKPISDTEKSEYSTEWDSTTAKKRISMFNSARDLLTLRGIKIRTH